ncbi:MAG: hypothetical protein JWQ06_1484 [Mucilaginibacter sp.]|nr:hypothetical protein [Mucilaginibacter sp.]
MNILITAATSVSAHRLKNKLNDQPVLLGDHLELPAFMLASGSVISLPTPNSAAYTHEMLTLCLDNDINTVYIFRAEEALLLLEAGQLFKEYDITLIQSDEI